MIMSEKYCDVALFLKLRKYLRNGTHFSSDEVEEILDAINLEDDDAEEIDFEEYGSPKDYY